jgi:hypothetical protein
VKARLAAGFRRFRYAPLAARERYRENACAADFAA